MNENAPLARRIAGVAAAAALLLPLAAAAADPMPLPEGFLCCNMRTDGSWISDANYQESGKRIIPVGTPVKATGYGRQRVLVDIGGSKQAIGNDYSRDLDLATFAKRYIVAEDPRPKIATFPAPVRQAIEGARVAIGMTREQVLMAVGYPMSSENPNLDAELWRFWLSSFAEFQVVFDDRGLVKEVDTDRQTRRLVVLE